MKKPRLLNTIFVVEGKNDRERLLKCGIPYVVITKGNHVPRETIEHLQALEKKHTIVILTDPDGPGQKISARLQKQLLSPICLFLPKAVAKGKKEVGIEHVALPLLQEILAPYQKSEYISTSDLTFESLLQYPLSQSGSKDYKAKVAKNLKLITSSLKNMYVQLLLLDINAKDIEALIHG